MTVTRLVRGLGLSAIVVAAGCASGSGRSGNGVPVLVRVENDAQAAEAVTVWLAPSDGARRNVGTVAASSTQLFRIELRPSNEYRLTAERQSGASVSSQPFRPDGTDLVDWRLSTNVVQRLQTVQP